jgi:hypothetical protein
MTYQLTITTKKDAILEFETKKDALDWMDTWENQDYQSLDWEEHATEMVLSGNNGEIIRVVYCELNEDT